MNELQDKYCMILVIFNEKMFLNTEKPFKEEVLFCLIQHSINACRKRTIKVKK